MEFYQLHQVNEWTCVKIVEYYCAKIKKKDWGTVLDSVKKDLQKVADYWTSPTDRNMDNPHFKVEVQKVKQQMNATENAVTHITENRYTKHSRSNNEEETSNTEATAPLKRIKTTKSPSASASPISDNENKEQDEPIEIDLMSIKKQLEMVPLIEWKVGNINITQKFRQYQRSVIDKAMNYGLKAFASIIVLSWSCPYSKFFTNREWDEITQTNPYVIQYPVIPSQISTVLREVAIKHSMGKESHIQADESELSKAIVHTFNDLCDVPIYSPIKMSEELHCDKLLYPYINSLFFKCLAEYEVRFNRTVNNTRKRPDFCCVVDDIPMLNSEIKPLGVTPLKKKKDFTKVHLRAKKSINQQLNLKGGPSETEILMNMGIYTIDCWYFCIWIFFENLPYLYNLGDVVESFFIDFKFGLYCSWPFQRTRLVIDRASMPLIESNFCHFVALEVHIVCPILLPFSVYDENPFMRHTTNFSFTGTSK
ncbi:hypothetical protein F8M41_010314 [Gigaspora margarita]|uniref:Uncharacterized protein n=1 Tax=Gigaspora margarita TaxID=4874 RepID=A0A8H3X0V1_GIGMA|nr:hypothetical protein F8M41_010314 [Gigaspora margarita]